MQCVLRNRIKRKKMHCGIGVLYQFLTDTVPAAGRGRCKIQAEINTTNHDSYWKKTLLLLCTRRSLWNVECFVIFAFLLEMQVIRGWRFVWHDNRLCNGIWIQVQSQRQMPVNSVKRKASRRSKRRTSINCISSPRSRKTHTVWANHPCDSTSISSFTSLSQSRPL